MPQARLARLAGLEDLRPDSLAPPLSVLLDLHMACPLVQSQISCAIRSFVQSTDDSIISDHQHCAQTSQ